MSELKLGMYENISNDAYHAQHDASVHFYSSSQLKDIIDDVEVFKKKYITKEIESMHIPAFDIGTYFHTAILEPHLLDSECAIWEGKTRRGKEWEAFKAKHNGKAIITLSEYEQAKNLIKATKESSVAMDLLKEGKAEVSLFVEVFVLGNVIYLSKDGGKTSEYKLSIDDGWIFHRGTKLNKAVRLRLKVRADMIDVKNGNIIDLKSTKGNAKNVQKTRYKTSDYVYDLSASMYLDLFNAYFLIEKESQPFKTFWWIYASKDYCNCRSYWTGVGPDGEVNDKTLRIGRSKWKSAALNIAKYQELDWFIPDEPACIESLSYEDEWLDRKDDVEVVENKKKFDKPKKLKTKTEPNKLDLL